MQNQAASGPRKIDYATKYEQFMKRVTGRTPHIPGIGSLNGVKFKGRPRAKPTPRPKAVTPKPPAGLDREAELQRWTKAQLYDKAKDFEIKGRSKMTKETLILAILEAERKQGKQANAA